MGWLGELHEVVWVKTLILCQSMRAESKQGEGVPGAALQWTQKTFITGPQEVQKPEVCSLTKAALRFNLGEVMRVTILLCV